ncbi:MAG: Clp protease N-terminal domain-containing protein, partial [Spongiibacter sp.]
MRIDRFTTSLQSALADAQSLALGRDHQFIEAEHLLSSMLNTRSGSVRPLLAQAQGNIPMLEQGLKQALDKLPRVEGAPGDVHVSQGLGRVFNVA